MSDEGTRSPLTLELPKWVDTNLTYEVMYSVSEKRWLVNPVAVRTIDEAIPF